MDFHADSRVKIMFKVWRVFLTAVVAAATVVSSAPAHFLAQVATPESGSFTCHDPVSLDLDSSASDLRPRPLPQSSHTCCLDGHNAAAILKSESEQDSVQRSKLAGPSALDPVSAGIDFNFSSPLQAWIEYPLDCSSPGSTHPIRI